MSWQLKPQSEEIARFFFGGTESTATIYIEIKRTHVSIHSWDGIKFQAYNGSLWTMKKFAHLSEKWQNQRFLFLICRQWRKLDSRWTRENVLCLAQSTKTRFFMCHIYTLRDIYVSIRVFVRECWIFPLSHWLPLSLSHTHTRTLHLFFSRTILLYGGYCI